MRSLVRPSTNPKATQQLLSLLSLRYQSGTSSKPALRGSGCLLSATGSYIFSGPVRYEFTVGIAVFSLWVRFGVLLVFRLHESDSRSVEPHFVLCPGLCITSSRNSQFLLD